MIRIALLLAVLSVALTVFSLVQLAFADGSRVRALPRAAWAAVILLLPLIGAIAWLTAGRPRVESVGGERTGGPAGRVIPNLPQRRPTRPAPAAPDDDQEFLDQVRRQAEEQRRRYREEREADSPDE